MPDTAPPGLVARNNQVVGSLLSIVALAVAVGLGAGLVLGTGTRGVSAILTLLAVAGGTFTLLLLAVGAMLRAVTPDEQWDREESQWREARGLEPLTAHDAAASRRARRRATVLAVLALVLGLALSVLPDLI